MKIALTILFAVAFLGSLYWIRTNHTEPEPYVSTVLSVAALLGMFHESPRKRPNIIPRFEGRQITRNSKVSTKYALVIENKGDIEAKDFHLDLKVGDDEKGPIVDAERQYCSSLKVPVIHSGQRLEWLAVFFLRGSLQFEATWGWTTGKNKREVRTGIIKLETLPRS
jgi:hypothetical protein